MKNLSTNFSIAADSGFSLRHIVLGLLSLSFGVSLNCRTAEAVQEEVVEQSFRADSDDEAGIAFFENRIRPLLVEHCLDCHSSETEVSGGLALDSRTQLLSGGDSGASVDLEAAEKSLLLRAVSYRDPNLQMPPAGKLSETAIADLRRWIELGLPDPRDEKAGVQKQRGLAVERASEHWAYRPRKKVFDFDSIDEFVDARLQSRGLQKLGRAEDAALVRRLTFDLNGLPPSRKQLAVFEANPGDYWEPLVDQLLADPAFGETFGRRWLDVVRYAESITLRGFVLPNAWRYRNYVVDSYNQDLPIDQFIREQIAGDLIAGRIPDELAEQIAKKRAALVATGFWALGNTNLEQQDKTQLEMDYIDEQLEVMGRAFLAQTIGCARCHDHKFDPIPTRDYYALAGIMRSTVALEHDNLSKWLDRPLPVDVAREAEFSMLKLQAEELRAKVADLKKAEPKKSSKKVDIRLLEGTVVDDSQAKLVGTWTPSSHVGRFVGSGYRYHDLESDQLKTATFEAEGLPAGDYEVRLAYSAGSNRATKVRVDVFSADGEKTIYVNQRKKPPVDGLWVSLGTFQIEKDGQAFVMLFSDGADGHVIADAVQFLPVVEKPALAKGAAKKNKRVDGRKRKLANLESQLRSVVAKLSERPKYLAIVQSDRPRDCRIHVRGNVHNLTETVPRGVLSAIGKAPVIAADSPGRMELAQWLSSADNPLTARVYANRVWAWLMGKGLVGSVNNFGTTGFAPTHPELLDWLAEELIRSGWSTKHLVKLIVCSDAYQRKLGGPDLEQASEDPGNTMYWRGHARRLTVEAFRDSMLRISGELAAAPSTGTIRSGTKSDYDYKHEGFYRSIYHPVFRNSLPELFEEFDFADPSTSVGQRARSTVASQALVLSNHSWIVARAKVTAAMLSRENKTNAGGWQDSEALLEDLYLRLLARQPTLKERELAKKFLGQDPSEERLAKLVHVLFASIDFRYLR